MEAVETRTDARRALLELLIDHAPLFPPASLPLADALAEHEAALRGDVAWMVNRFVCPASVLAALPADRPPRLSIVLDGPWEERPALDDTRAEAVELPMPANLAAVAAAAPEVYVELPTDEQLERRVERLAALGLRAKVRCGGAALPTVGELAAFIRCCRDAAVPFKATAGLHHAVRGKDGHGFLNLLAAVVFGDEEDALAETDPRAFRLGPDAFAWRTHSAGAADLAAACRSTFVSIGSCSFSEPVDELRSLGVLAP